MRSRFESVVTLPTDERVVGVPRCCCSATAGRQALDRVDLGHAHLVDQPPRVRRDRLEVAALRLGVERAEGERRLARARDAGEHDERVARNVDVDVLEVVLARAAHADETVACALRVPPMHVITQFGARRSRAGVRLAGTSAGWCRAFHWVQSLRNMEDSRYLLGSIRQRTTSPGWRFGIMSHSAAEGCRTGTRPPVVAAPSRVQLATVP